MRLGSRACLLSALLFVSGCGVARKLNPVSALESQPRLPVRVDDHANGDSPVAVDLVAVNDKDLAKDVAKMTAADWFSKRDQIREDYPKTGDVTITSWEWVPGQVVPALDLPKKKARELLIFANYATPGPHRAKIDPNIPERIALNRDDLKVEPLAK